MKCRMTLLLLVVFVLSVSAAQAVDISVRLTPDKENSGHPTMGDTLQFRSRITAPSDRPLEGVVAWISLVEIDPGQEQPVDLEDWSAHKAVFAAHLEPAEELDSTWSVRLIKAGDYRVAISVMARDQAPVFTSPTVKFHVFQKPVVESRRIFPVAIGVPLLLLGLLGYRWQASHRRNPI